MSPPEYEIRHDTPGIPATFVTAAPARCQPEPGVPARPGAEFEVALAFEDRTSGDPFLVVVRHRDLSKLQDALDYCENNIQALRGMN